MNCSIVVANGENTEQIRITEVDRVAIENEVYFIYNNKDKVLFSSPIDSTVYLAVE